MAEDRLFAEGFDRHLVELVAPGAGEIGEVLLRILGELDVGAGELVPGAPADRDHGGDAPAGRLSARPLSSTFGLRETATARPLSRPSRRSSQRSAAKSSSERAMPASRISSTVTPWSIAAWSPRLSARLWRACTASTAGSAPSAPIASVASSQSRSRERAIRQPLATTQRKQSAARVGEVEGEQAGRDRRDREPAQGRR